MMEQNKKQLSNQQIAQKEIVQALNLIKISVSLSEQLYKQFKASGSTKKLLNNAKFFTEAAIQYFLQCINSQQDNYSTKLLTLATDNVRPIINHEGKMSIYAELNVLKQIVLTYEFIRFSGKLDEQQINAWGPRVTEHLKDCVAQIPLVLKLKKQQASNVGSTYHYSFTYPGIIPQAQMRSIGVLQVIQRLTMNTDAQQQTFFSLSQWKFPATMVPLYSKVAPRLKAKQDAAQLQQKKKVEQEKKVKESQAKKEQPKKQQTKKVQPKKDEAMQGQQSSSQQENAKKKKKKSKKDKKSKKSKKVKKDKKKKKQSSSSSSQSQSQSEQSVPAPPQPPPVICQCRAISSSMPIMRNADKKVIYRPCANCLILIAIKIDMAAALTFGHVHNQKDILTKRMRMFQRINAAPAQVRRQFEQQITPLPEIKFDQLSFSTLAQYQFIHLMASKYFLRVSSDPNSLKRIAQLHKEQSKSGITYKLTVFLPDATSNITFGSVEQDYRWASGSFCEYTWGNNGWNITTGQKSGSHPFKTQTGNSYMLAIVNHIRLNPVAGRANPFNDNPDDFC